MSLNRARCFKNYLCCIQRNQKGCLYNLPCIRACVESLTSPESVKELPSGIFIGTTALQPVKSLPSWPKGKGINEYLNKKLV